MTVRVIALGSESARDDAAALVAARRIEGAEVVLAGRPGPGLVDLLDARAPTVLIDVTRSGARPGAVIRIPLDALVDHAVALPQVSSHGFGPAEALRLARALGNSLPMGFFVGIEGERFEPGVDLSDTVARGLDSFVAEIRAAIEEASHA